MGKGGKGVRHVLGMRDDGESVGGSHPPASRICCRSVPAATSITSVRDPSAPVCIHTTCRAGPAGPGSSRRPRHQGVRAADSGVRRDSARPTGAPDLHLIYT
jgi:hypothetical protein